ncbi:Nucleoside-diphosphate-sugar epimerase [Actinacidiphila yanglinensis]|uniref:Nucleoside-diphosphate-sugar epimerase n=1 Tax=Actinacidiphila yanglinensis TaxID=310779 RepID=A0A1H6D989_9ACTN|nr:NAD-dependent epimerase/dehydratase family protein [Actinacidiphila yanglinensis]SEG81911.1 Nucleoside-diphosphate-sugar epimerase [Actinacidiphila yanglinensis]
MRVFLTGGSGYLGTATIKALLRHGHDVTALARSEASAETLAGLGAAAVRGALADTEVLTDAAAAADGVLHLGSDPGPNTAEVDLAAALAMLAGLGGRGAYVHTGGVWVYGDTDGVVDEDAPQSPPPITAWRRSNEDRVLAATADGGRPVLVMPGVVHGRGQGLIETFYTAPGRANGAVPLIGDGDNHWALVHVDDIAELYALALNAEGGSVYAGVSDENPRQADIARAVSRAAGCEGSFERLTVEEAERRMGPIARAFALDQQLTGARARKDLGWSPRHLDALTDLAAIPGA